MNKQTIGIKEQIQRAETRAEIGTLLGKGYQFANASAPTRRSWERAAARRAKELDKSTK